jgi:hypothetical protein
MDYILSAVKTAVESTSLRELDTSRAQRNRVLLLSLLPEEAEEVALEDLLK